MLRMWGGQRRRRGEQCAVLARVWDPCSESKGFWEDFVAIMPSLGRNKAVVRKDSNYSTRQHVQQCRKESACAQ